ncbi:MAG: methylenetetrahydrofolate reductase [NAD(P)H] [Spirochaetes bacterium GWD1_27_9]|nr:MAG: methylenetetrahydrofolate reductase [NAD(P)H] [Spirochaetes bacterium GWB1_27_13]OHD23319.1 MAG: methylenetetrahydrofolate reductase [NAD(P)H] [Spirochaetes bacterium GWC1_27_15]OHD44397.1 MAG: methylenetetrahydrofolate reductase [NAD(P)H] [Spirochaetes bacterium GWD1_27_9]
MFIKNMFQKGKHVVSFEVFPPKKEDDVLKLYHTIEDLKSLNPDYVSVTYGAGGTTRDKSVDIASHIKNHINLEVVAHLTCVNNTKNDVINVLDQLKSHNIKNILALRGDPSQGQTNFTKTIGGFGYAYELVDFIKDKYDFSVAVAGYPEGHIETPDLDKDISYLKMKVEAGADVIITQLFFNNDDFYKFRDIAVKKGINIPIIPGIFPILNYKSVQRITSLCGAKIPSNLVSILEKNQDNIEEIEKIGIEYAIKQLDDLLNTDIEGVHFYSMNKSKEIKEIYNGVKNKIKRIEK